MQVRTHFNQYKIHSLSEEEFSLSERNIFIFTPERFLSFMDSHQHLHFDFAFIDEVYKIDNSFIIDPGNYLAKTNVIPHIVWHWNLFVI